MADWEEGRQQVLDDISRINGGGCDAGLSWTADLSSAFGVQVRSLGLALTRSLSKGVPITEVGGWSFLDYDGCGSASLACYFQPLLQCRVGRATSVYTPPSAACPNLLESTCSEGDAVEGGVVLLGGGLAAGDGVFLDFFGRNSSDSSRHGVFRMASPPRGYEHKGALWWLSSVHSLLLRPNTVLLGVLRKARAVAGLWGPYVGMHIRRGDMCVARDCKNTLDYFQAAVRICRRYGMNKVFVASDGLQVLGDLQKLGGGIEWLSARGPGGMQGGTGAEFRGVMWPQMLRTRMGLIDRKNAAESTFVDLMLLSEADAMVITSSSSFSLLSLELNAARTGFLPPYVAIGGPWWPLVT